MSTNSYAGYLPDWKIDLIRTRARQHGFAPHEIDDVVQDVVIELRDFTYDPSRAASEKTAWYVVVSRIIASLRRGRLRRLQHQEAITRSTVDTQPQSYSDPDPCLAADVAGVVATLVPQEQDICRLLMQGRSVRAIASDLACHWDTVQRGVDSIRRRFSAHGLDPAA